MEKNKKTQSVEEILLKDSEMFILDNRFKIIRTIGIGGMGEIFLAEDLKLRRLVAVKSIKKGTDSSKESQMRFLREAQTASQLEHNNICPIYEIYEEENNHYIVMQFIDGVALDTIIKYKELSINKVIDIALQICDGMSEAHEKGIIHRDLKPGNIIIDKKGVVKILDFGLAKFSLQGSSMKTGIVNSNLTEKGIVMGTVSYMSPEQARGEELDGRSDIFSFGILLYELIERNNPFYDKEQINTLYNVINKEIKFSDKFPALLADLVSNLLNKDKDNRYASFKEIKEVLVKLQEEIIENKSSENKVRATEIIDMSEKREILEEVKRTSDFENLGDLVYKIKKIKAPTIPVSGSKKKTFKKFSMFLVPVLILFSLFLFFKNRSNLSFSGGNDIFFITINDLKGKVPNRVKEEIKFLIMESLNQFDEFDTVSTNTVKSIYDSSEKISSPEETKENNRIFYDIDGEVSKIKNIYNFDMVIHSNDRKKKYSITIPGLKNENSILKHQIDTLSKRVYSKIFPQNKGYIKIKPISKSFGEKWKNFEIFFKGMNHFFKYEYTEAEKCFVGQNETPVDKYYLSQIYYFNGKRDLSEKKIKEIIPNLKYLSKPFGLKVLAMNSRLEFNFKEEIGYLQNLRKRNDLSKKTLFKLGEAFFHHGDAQKASKYYLEALKLDEKYSSAINHLGYCYSYMGNHTKAIELFEEYRNLDNSANSFDSLGDGYFFAGDLISSEASKKAAVRKDSKGLYWAYMTLSDIAILKAKFKEAENEVENYLRETNSKKDKANAYSKLAYAEYLKENYDNALEIAKKSIDIYDSDDINSNSSEIRWIRALINHKLKKKLEFSYDLEWIGKIVEKYKLSKENFSRPFKFFVHLKALEHELNGEIDEADSKFMELLKINYRLNYWITIFNYQFFHTEYAEFLLRNGNLKKSEVEINKCLEFSSNYIPALWVKARILEQTDVNSAENIYKMIDDLYGNEKENNIITEKLRVKLEEFQIKLLP